VYMSLLFLPTLLIFSTVMVGGKQGNFSLYRHVGPFLPDARAVTVPGCARRVSLLGLNRDFANRLQFG
jgi:hypothetical protein